MPTLKLEKSLEPEVHIVDRYMQLVKGSLTMTNIMLESGKEIDILAHNPLTQEKYHIEVRIATGKGFRLRMLDTQTSKGIKHKRGLDTLNAVKFTHPIVTAKIQQIFGTSEYRKVLVVWDVQSIEVLKQAKDAYDIEIWKISDILNEMQKELKSQPFRDDVLRTIQLISKTHY